MSLYEFIVKNLWIVMFGILAGVATVLIICVRRFYRKTRGYHPISLSVMGTTYVFPLKNKEQHWMHKLMEKTIVEVLKKDTYAGIPQFKEMMKIFLEDPNDTSTDVATSDLNSGWEALREATHSAFRRYVVSERLPALVSQVVDDILEEIHKEGETAFDITPYSFLAMCVILSSLAFGRRYVLHDSELLAWIEGLEAQCKVSDKRILLSALPSLRFIFSKTYNSFVDIYFFQSHLEKFDGVNIRDFTDALLMAKKKAEEEHKESQKYFHLMNIINTVNVLFAAGSETSSFALMWCFLFLANYPALQKQIRDEIEQTIGLHWMPHLDHRNKCPLTSAFIAEVTRFRPITFFGAMVDSEINGHPVKADTNITLGLHQCLEDKDIWGDPEVFRPERFLNNGQFMSKSNPFSVGRQSSPEDKLSLTIMFFILARFLQKTKGMTIQLENGPGSVDLTADPKKSAVIVPCIIPQDFKIKLVQNV